jgi:hypothetical protein
VPQIHNVAKVDTVDAADRHALSADILVDFHFEIVTDIILVLQFCQLFLIFLFLYFVVIEELFHQFCDIIAELVSAIYE